MTEQSKTTKGNFGVPHGKARAELQPVAQIGDRVQCDVRNPTQRTITMVLQTPEAVAHANWLLANKSSGWRLAPPPPTTEGTPE